MADRILTEFFKYDRWLTAINTADCKGINKGNLRKLCTPEMREQLLMAIVQGNYEIAPPHAQLIPKDKPGEFRTVYINEDVDRIFLSIANGILFDLCSDMVHPQCKSYQTGIGCGKVVQQCSSRIAKANGECIGWKSDLSKYFDSVPLWAIMDVFDRVERKCGHSVIIDVLRKYYMQNLCFDVEGNLQNKYMSLMQGCAVASFLADAVLYKLDECMSGLKGFYVRYSDDCLYIGKDYEYAMELMRKELGRYELTLNPRKVECLDANHWFKFLGFSIKGSEISISKGRLKTFQREIEKRTIRNRSTTYLQAVNAVNRYLYVGDGKHSWASGILPIVNSAHDLQEMNEFIMDCLRATQTGKRKVGGLGYEPHKREGVVTRGTGRNVKANRAKTETELVGYASLGMMRNALLTDRAAYEALVRCL